MTAEKIRAGLLLHRAEEIHFCLWWIERLGGDSEVKEKYGNQFSFYSELMHDVITDDEELMRLWFLCKLEKD